ncbi:MAG: insulinase family protein [Eubacterium sp.]|nr:insulinase family protein [Eubacterium sp.]
MEKSKKMTAAYEMIKEEYLEDVRAKGTLLIHKKSGARVALLSNDDENKVFSIAFRTPPQDSTGVAHIIEHTVLCGSRKFPLKDPFVELAKGSLNTFLNAMTYPDKTMYPIGSCNDVDFRNLMDVYLDAVFYPNIYKEEKIFRQEGWHYHLEEADASLSYNGVVYNEMKGVFSSPDEMLQRAVFNTLFPDTPYGVESGGDPEVIPELTYEDFLDFHRRYYHPSNSYIYLYGNVDMEERLAWLDEHYLSHFDRITVDSAIPLQKPFAEPVYIEQTYPILDEESEESKTYLTWNTVVGRAADVEQNVAFAILKYVLLDAPGAPVKQALLDAQIGKDIGGSFEDGILQPFFSVEARNAEVSDRDRFLSVIHDTLASLAENGLNRRALASGINYLEFRFREADYASYPKGLIYGIDMMDNWLYDETDPFAYLKELAVFDSLKKKAGQGYFEELIRTKLLDNPHQSVVVLKPQKKLAAEREEKTAAALAAYKATLSKEEIEAIAEETKALQVYQEEDDTPEVKQTIPQLSREDIAPEMPVRISAEKTVTDGTVYLKHHYATNGIGYLTLLFDTAQVPDEMIPWLGLLNSVLGRVSTEHYTYGDLFHEINANSGGISFGLSVYPCHKGEDGDTGSRMLGVKAKYLYPQRDFVFRMIREILATSDLTDSKRLKEIMDSTVSGMQNFLAAAGHASAAGRALAAQSPLSAWTDRTAGISFYRFMEDLGKNFDSVKEEITQKLTLLAHMLFRPENLTVSLTADEEGFAGMEEQTALLKKSLYTDEVPRGAFAWEPCVRREAFKTSGQVQYVALAGNYRKAGLPYTGHLRVLKTILSFEYLWMNIRVLGGAYGCMTAMKRSGDSYLVSYRDPHLKETLDVYRALPAWLQELDLDERTMTKYIIGTISEMDTPMNPSAKGAFALLAYFAGLTDEDLQKERTEVLTAQPEQIRALAAYMQAVIDEGNICVIGSESAVENTADLFDVIEPLVKL